ncbi:exodeoxyribonuclease V subunit beta [Verticiella sediminum]|uniref:RecBCD enzyme subunit RecB n=1 Tax=Verticiella sediminum TaxID=1247510 RepID=A0A556AYV2_9BURK|nr:exodeoxyribonuclease V subunit beta [Verticiella sediminum]TSH98123.1 exodeoxyribonuclease V subunit beta [Verticiella sediminum]
MSAPVIPTLDPLRFPLHGSRLIEASAGTGKTYTIAALYLRLVLGHGGEDAYPRPLDPPEILVVTFTEAATQELRDRIRRQLSAAAQAFRQPAHEPPGDAFLRQLRDDHPEARWPACAHRLQLAAEWMDEAAIHTIHGWCNRMLGEHAFDSDSLFTQTLEADNDEFLTQAARDYWRSFLVPLPASSAQTVHGWWPQGPDDLLAAVRPLMPYRHALAHAEPPARALAAAEQTCTERLAELKSPWPAWADALQALCDEAVAAKQVNGTRLRAQHYTKWFDALRAWAADPALRRPELSAAARARLTPAGMAEAWKQGEPPAHPGLDAMAALHTALDELPDAHDEVLVHAARWISTRFDQALAQRARMGFDDLLTRLAAALDGPNAERLAARIRQQFPVALIDEFQDTDPVQFRIFDAVYRMQENAPDRALVLIGDPKQAIYAFRGADIHTYLDARARAGDRLYTLRRNFRSSASMVAAVNHVFAAAETRADGNGAFLFRRDGGNPVPFLPVEARHGDGGFVLDGKPCTAALTLWQQPRAQPERALGKGAYRQAQAAACASQIVRLLDAGLRGRAILHENGKTFNLRPADIAVLVSNRTEAAEVRDALRERGVRSVYLSDQDSVYQSAQAVELQHWLGACAEPENPRLLRAALASPTLGLPWSALDRLGSDELAWEARVLQFRDYRETWRRQGVLPMLRRLMQDFGVPARLLAPGWRHPGGASGERVLTDFLHLAELLQQASALLDGEHALIRHLAQARAEGRRAGGGDARQLRLESDADIVQIVTIHKSKGLEYPLVFLPFAADCRPVDAGAKPPWVWRDGERVRVALQADDAVLAAADRERLGEDLRKLYVALTRAKHATWVGVGALADLPRSALGYLAGLQDEGELDAQLRRWAVPCASIAVEPVPMGDAGRYAPPATADTLGPARQSRRVHREAWWVASYSALAYADTAHDPHAPQDDTPDQDQLRELSHGQDEIAAAATGSAIARGIHAFARGAQAGTFLHDLLEWCATQGFAAVRAQPDVLRDLIARRCQRRGWESHIEALTDWMLALLETPLPCGNDSPAFRLGTLAAYRAELEFWLPSHRLDTERIDALVRAGTLQGAPRPALLPQQLNGMLKGYIDLVLEHEGRYYVADYKSNWLGPDAAAYTPQAMRSAILASRYELQYALYLLALHRLLRARLPDYDYDRHVGGAVYLFLRGLDAPGAGVHIERPPRSLIEALDAAFAGRDAPRGRRP